MGGERGRGGWACLGGCEFLELDETESRTSVMREDAFDFMTEDGEISLILTGVFSNERGTDLPQCILLTTNVRQLSAPFAQLRLVLESLRFADCQRRYRW